MFRAAAASTMVEIPLFRAVCPSHRLCNDPREERRRRHSVIRLTRHAIGVVLALGCTALAAQQRSPSPSAPAVYTASQATAGEKIYFAQCAACHGDDLAGREKAPALAGPQFSEAWNGKDLRGLLDRIETMPPTAPKSLPPAQYVSVLAFMLRQAG